MKLALALIRTDGGTQTRAEIDRAVVDDYAEKMRAGEAFPPLVVFYDGEDYWLADGFHRHGAADAADIADVDVVVHQGTQRDAILFAVGANAKHGLRRTNADKRRAVEMLLRDREWTMWSDREIAEHVAVDHKTVARWRSEMVSTGEIPQCEDRRTADGRVMNVANIGKPVATTQAQMFTAATPAMPVAPSPLAKDLPHETNPFEDDDGEEEPPVVAPTPEVRVEAPRRGFGQSDVADRLARVNGAVRRFDVEIRAAFADIDPRFDAEVRERAQDFLLNAADVLREFLSDTPARPALSVIRGGRS